ncbi:hypothetical protein V5N34_29360 [Streptomyces baarnensis]|uniref:hypothetical protein n=1 Tax=Streptomyces baarnensis TaxID=66872 RepID=UPI003081687A
MVDADALLNRIETARDWAQGEAQRHRMAHEAGAKREPDRELAIAYLAITSALNKILEVPSRG